MLVYGILALLALHATGIYAQIVTSASGSEAVDKPAGLPNVEWNVLRIDPAARDNLCQRQTAYCANNCGGPNQAPKNFCNVTTLAWGCGCSHKVADFSAFLWPVVQAECSGKAQDCQMICNKNTVNPSTCAATCNSYYRCDTDKAPPSYLQTENPTDIPSYNGPKQGISTSNNPNGTGNSSDSQTSDSIKMSSHVYVLTAFIAMTMVTM